MVFLRLYLGLIYVILVYIVDDTFCQTSQAKHVLDKGHPHTTPPCDTCPRQGKCVPHIQCPAHVRPNSHNPLCHIRGQQGLVGICCFTGSQHAAESDRKARASNSIRPEDVKISHSLSKKKLTEWLKKSERLESVPEAILNTTSPSYAHHLSTVTYDEMANKLGHGGLLNLFATHELKGRDAITDDQIQLGLTDHANGPFCPTPPSCPAQPSRYRSIGGDCNNPTAARWGAVHTGFERLLPPHYDDGIWSLRSSSIGLPLPSPRVVSIALIPDSHIPSTSNNLLFMQFGQFIAHDTTSGVMFTIGNGSAISCCVGDGQDFLPPELQHWACAPIAAPEDDPFYSQFGQRCLNLVRTQLAPSSDCTVGYAKPMNGVTHYADLSQLYGSSVEKLKALRGPGGSLKVFNDYGRQLPPLTEGKECLSSKDGAACFESGDNHGNQVISLTVLHTIWTREHNRVAAVLSRLNPDWDEDRIFFETRKIVQAEFENIIYTEWLPLLLGPQIIERFGLRPANGYSNYYNPLVNPSLTAEFAAAAMRFGHSVVDSKFYIPKSNGELYEAISIPEVMFQPSRMRLKPFFDRLIAGLMWQPMQSVDPFVTESLTRYLFHGGNPFGLDLASINIQRGRDYGLRSYNEYRKLAGLEPFVDFRQFPPGAAQRLSSIYNSPEDIDLWVGGLLEEPVPGGVVGETFANILADQFIRLKKGDRYFYENGPEVNPGAFTLGQLKEIRKATLARLICDNKDGIELEKVAPKAFLKSDLQGNEPVSCNNPIIPEMDLIKFKEI